MAAVRIFTFQLVQQGFTQHSISLAVNKDDALFAPFFVLTGFLTCGRDPAGGQCLVGSLTGAVASERVSEALKGSLRMVGNHSKSAKAEGSLTATPTGGAGTKVGLSDPVV